MSKWIRVFKVFLVCMAFAFIGYDRAIAEPFMGAIFGWQFGQEFDDLEGNENVNYPNDHVGTYPSALNPAAALYRDTRYSDMKLKNTLPYGVRGGYYLKSVPSLGAEVEFSYSHPKIKTQYVKLSHSGFSDSVNGLGLGQDNFSEDQDPANNRLFLISFHGLFRYQGIQKITPYIGAGPGIFVFRITGTGHSGVITDPSSLADPNGVDGPGIHATSVKVGLSSKAGVEYSINAQWGIGFEYHFKWSPVEIPRFRSASDINGEYWGQSINVVLHRHF